MANGTNHDHTIPIVTKEWISAYDGLRAKYEKICNRLSRDLKVWREIEEFEPMQWSIRNARHGLPGFAVSLVAVRIHNGRIEGFSVGMTEDYSDNDAIVRVSDEVQNWLADDNIRWPFWRHSYLSPVHRGGKAVWVDEKTGESVAEIGELRHLDS